MKMVVNACFGGFSLSSKAQKILARQSGQELFFYKDCFDKHGNHCYVRVSEYEKDRFIYAVTKDLGKRIKKFQKVFAGEEMMTWTGVIPFSFKSFRN